MVVYLHEALEHKLQSGKTLTIADVEEAAIEGAAHRLRPKLMTVCAVLASLVPILWEAGIGSEVMKPIAAPIVGGMITSSIHVLILVPVFLRHDEGTIIEAGEPLRQTQRHEHDRGGCLWMSSLFANSGCPDRKN